MIALQTHSLGMLVVIGACICECSRLRNTAPGVLQAADLQPAHVSVWTGAALGMRLCADLCAVNPFLCCSPQYIFTVHMNALHA